MRPILATISITALMWTAATAAAFGAATVYRLETIAGTSDPGDGGPAIAAQLSAIQGIAVDRSGNIYLSDTDQPLHPESQTGRHHQYPGGHWSRGFERRWRASH